MRDDKTPGNRGGNVFQSLTASDLLAESSFHISSSPEEDGQRWSLWGRGAFSRFDGRDGDLMLDGDVTTATLGADYASDRRLAGVALSHSQGDGTFSLGGFEVEAASSLAGLYPYLRYGVNDGLAVWGMAGYSAGTLTLTADGAEPIETGIAIMMGATGARGELLSPAQAEDFALTLKADTLFLRTVSDRVPVLTATEASVIRVRLGLESSYEFILDDGAWLAPFIEASLRHDGGDAETGFGVDIGGGLRYAHPELAVTAELDARGLLAHENDGFKDWGVSGSLRYDPYRSSDQGLSLSLKQSMGSASSGGMDALWERGTGARLAVNDNAGLGGQFDARAAYGFSVFGSLVTGTPWAGVSLSERGRDFRFGYSLGFGPSLDMGVEGMHRRGNEAQEYKVMLRGELRW